jgi:hypothetical protein
MFGMSLNRIIASATVKQRAASHWRNASSLSKRRSSIA